MSSPSPLPRRASALSPSSSSPSSPIPARFPADPSSPSIGRITPTRRPSALSSGVNTEQRRARREQLRNFYGIKEGATGSGSGSGSPVRGGEEGKGDAGDIDSPTFNPSTYYPHLLTTSSLPDLLKTSSSLSADIANLHSSRHALVYNHHHQLFAAGDTIAHLNSRTPQLLSIVQELQSSFSEISRLVEAVSGLGEGRGPGKGEGLGEGKAEEGQGEGIEGGDTVKVKRGLEKLRLMRLAEEPPDTIRECYESFRADLEKMAEDGKSSAVASQGECQRILDELPHAAPDKEEKADS